VIGEAVKKIPADIREKYPEIPWQEIAGMRDKLVHEYFRIDIKILWDTVQADLKPLQKIIKKLRLDLKQDPS